MEFIQNLKRHRKFIKIFVLAAIYFLGLTAFSQAQSWHEIQKVVAPDRASEEWFGWGTSISGNYAIIGSPRDDEDANGANPLEKAGSAYIYEKDNAGNWNLAQKITASDRATEDQFGKAVDISGGYAIVGASREDEDANGANTINAAGSAYIFERDASGVWHEVKKITEPVGQRQNEDFFGLAVAIDGDYVVVAENEGWYNGAVHVFERVAGDWVYSQKLFPSTSSAAASFGRRMSLNGNDLIVGALGDKTDENGENLISGSVAFVGAAFIFQRANDGTWNEVQKIVASDREADHHFGVDVSIDGDYAVVADVYDDNDENGLDSAYQSGSAYIFKRNESGIWSEVQKVMAPIREKQDYFGASVSISGDRFIVGSESEDEDGSEGNTATDAGSAYIFQRDNAGVWNLEQKVVHSDRAAHDSFGMFVSMDGENILIGAYEEQEDENGQNTLIAAGSAYFFEWMPAPWIPINGGPETHIITIPADVAVNIEGQGLETGDFIGLFFTGDDGSLGASDVVKWTGANTTLTAMGDDPSTTEKDGFDAGENFGIKVYKTTTEKEYTASATWDTNYPFSGGYFTANALSKITALEKCRSQFVSLCEGWNLISLNVVPSSQSMGNIFNQAGNVIVKNSAGAIQYAPEFGIVSGTWNPLEGYLIYSPAAVNIEVCGDPVDPQTTINIPNSSYPYFLPYYYTHEAPATEMLAPLGTNYIFAQGMECASGTTDVYNYIPEHIISPAIDEIGLMKPGLAYKIMATDAITFTYPVSNPVPNGGRIAGRAIAEHFIPGAASPQNAVVVFSKEALSSLGLEEGDEIGVFAESGEMLLGAVVYEGEALALTVFGASEGEKMAYRVWRKAFGEETTLSPSYSYGTGNFAVNTVHVISKVERGLASETGQSDFMIYPNPSSGILNINYHADEKGEINIAMYNLQGIQMIDKRVKVSAGNNNIKSNISHFPNGLYTVIIGQDGEIIADKVVIRK